MKALLFRGGLPLAVLALVETVSAVRSQQVPQQTEAADPTRIILDVTRVNILYTVTDKKGRFVTDLAKDDFQIFESKKPQIIQQFTAESDLPLRAGGSCRHQQQHPRAD